MSRFRKRGNFSRSKHNGNRGTKRYFEMQTEQSFEYDTEDNLDWKESFENQSKKRHQLKEHTHLKNEKNYQNKEADGTNPDLKESLIYYEKVLSTLKQGIDNEGKDVFASNVLEQTKGQEVELSCHKSSSHCIELLLSRCQDKTIFLRFMKAFENCKDKVCMNGNASHIAESLIYFALQNMQNWSSIMQSSDDLEKQKEVTDIITWLHSLGEFFVENLNLCLGNIYACHVLTTLIQALGGQYSDDKNYVSKKSRTYKAKFHEQHFGEEITRTKTPIIYEEIPKFFINTLKNMSKVLLQQENIADLICDSSSATVVQALLMVVKKRLPKYCKKIVTAISTQVFSKKNYDGIPVSFLHKNSSYVVEKIFESALEEHQGELWLQYFAPCLEQLVVHPVGNFVIQRLFDVVTSKTQFEIMSEAAGKYFDNILESRCYGIFFSMATACNRLKAQQAQFVQNMMLCLQCHEPEDRQLHLVPMLLGFKKYDKYLKIKETAIQSTYIDICLQGSLVVQAILRFHKPIKAVKSILNMKPADLALLAGHMQGCHVLTCFFESNNVGEKNKDKLIHHMKPVFSAMASDRNGSLTLSRMWVLLTLKQKSLLAGELSIHEKKLQDNNKASIVLKKFGVFHFKHNPDKWKEIQVNFAKTRAEPESTDKSV